MAQEITSFRGPYSFLSNFAPYPCPMDGLPYPTAEHAYQAHKTTDRKQRFQFLTGTPGQAKRLGQKIRLRPDWEEKKLSVMYSVLEIKFDENKEAREKLLDTADCELIEGNTWGDSFWGVCEGFGENHLGRLLMQLRESFRRCPGGVIEIANKYHLTPEAQQRCVYIGRGSPLGNPFKVKPHGPHERGATLELYEEYLRAEIQAGNRAICDALDEIWKRPATGGRVRLMCFCKPRACHGDVIRKIIEEQL